MSGAATPTSPHQRLVHLRRLQRRLAVCRACQDAGLLARANPIAGDQGLRRLMLLGQAPGRHSDAAGVPFAGPSGRQIERWLRQAGFAEGALRRDVYLTSVTRCDPGKSRAGAGDRPPGRDEQALCAHWWRAELALLRPAVLLLCGRLALAQFYPPQPLEALVGTWRREGDTWLLPLPHPSGVSRWLNDPGHRALVDRALAQLAEWRVALALDRERGEAANGGADG